METSIYDILIEGTNRQKKYCSEKDVPMFAPRSGVCYFCNSPIYDIGDGNPAYSLEYASTHLITGCRKCSRSFVD